MSGKGSTQRPTDHKTYSDNYDRIFNNKKRRETMTGRMPCSITDDPYNDYSDYIEKTGVYSQPTEEEEHHVQTDADDSESN